MGVIFIQNGSKDLGIKGNIAFRLSMFHIPQDLLFRLNMTL